MSIVPGRRRAEPPEYQSAALPRPAVPRPGGPHTKTFGDGAPAEVKIRPWEVT